MKITVAERSVNLQSSKNENMEFEWVENFTYLGTNINKKNLIAEEINIRIINADRAFFANNKILKSKLVPRSTKMKYIKF